MASITNFTLYYEARGDDANLPASFWADVEGKSSNQIRFFEDDQYTVECKRYITYFNVSQKILIAHVRISSIDDSADKPFYIAIRNSAVSQSMDAFVPTDGAKFLYNDFTKANSNSLTTSFITNGLMTGIYNNGFASEADANYRGNINAKNTSTGATFRYDNNTYVDIRNKKYSVINCFKLNAAPSADKKLVGFSIKGYYGSGYDMTQDVSIKINASKQIYIINNYSGATVNTFYTLNDTDAHSIATIADFSTNNFKIYIDGFFIAEGVVAPYGPGGYYKYLSGVMKRDDTQVQSIISDYAILGELSDDYILAYHNNTMNKLEVQNFDNKVIE